MKSLLKKRFELLKKFRWIARISSLISIAVLLMFFFGESRAESGIAASEWIGLVFFPIGVVFGFIAGWKREILGGLISLASLAGFYLIYGFAINGQIPKGIAFLIFTFPAFIFLASGIYAYFAIGKLSAEINE